MDTWLEDMQSVAALAVCSALRLTESYVFNMAESQQIRLGVCSVMKEVLAIVR